MLSPLGFGLDENAIGAVSMWRFKPGMKDGSPEKIRATVEVSFRLLGRSYDEKAEKRRTDFNAIVSRLAKSGEGKPSEKDIAIMQDLADHKLPAALYLTRVWQFEGQAVAKDVASGLADIQKAADRNYGPALFFIGNAQMHGQSIPKDTEQGIVDDPRCGGAGQQVGAICARATIRKG